MVPRSRTGLRASAADHQRSGSPGTWPAGQHSAARPAGDALVALRALPVRERRGLPVLADGGRVVPPGAELRLRELRVPALEPDAVGVAPAQVGDEDLARVLVLPARRDLEIDLEEGVGVTVEDGGHVV